MEINILKQDKNKIEFEIEQEDHTLCNAIRKELWNYKEIEISAYNIEHPLVSSPIMLVETNKGDPKKIVLKAVDSLKKQIKSIKEEVNKKL